mgnify:CR=1 FL=1
MGITKPLTKPLTNVVGNVIEEGASTFLGKLFGGEVVETATSKIVNETNDISKKYITNIIDRDPDSRVYFQNLYKNASSQDEVLRKQAKGDLTGLVKKIGQEEQLNNLDQQISQIGQQGTQESANIAKTEGVNSPKLQINPNTNKPYKYDPFEVDPDLSWDEQKRLYKNAITTWMNEQFQAGKKVTLPDGYQAKGQLIDPKTKEPLHLKPKKGRAEVERTGRQDYQPKLKETTEKEVAKRKLGLEFDNDSISKVFETKGLSKVQANKQTKAYIAASKKIKDVIQNAIKTHNKANETDILSIEHIFDVQNYTALGMEVPGFAGKGADELGNLTVLGRNPNAQSGAMVAASTEDIGQRFISSIENFVDYDKSISDFIDNDIVKNINNFTQETWDEFAEIAINNQNTPILELLVKFIQQKQI